MIAIGIFLEILAAALGTLSKQLIAMSEHYKRPCLFHTGATINIAVGPIVDASAYAFAPQVIVAPFACLDVIFNALTAPYTLKWQNEVLTRVHILGTGCVAAGAALTSVFADAEDLVYDVYLLEAQLLRPLSIGYFCLELFSIISASIMLRKGLMTSMVRGIALGVIAGVLMGNVFFVKGIVSLVRHSISTGDTEAWLRITPYACIACAAGGAIVGHMFMRKGLGEYKGVFMVTIFEGAHITAACLSGCVVMSEMSGSAWWRYICYWASVGLIILGMLAINTAAADSKIGKQVHIAEHWAPQEEDEKAGFVDGAAPAPITSAPVGKTLSDGEEIDLGDFSNQLSDGSPISITSENQILPGKGFPGFSIVSPLASPDKKKFDKGDTGETSSNVSTSTPEGDLEAATGSNGHEKHNGHDKHDVNILELPPVFTGSDRVLKID